MFIPAIRHLSYDVNFQMVTSALEWNFASIFTVEMYSGRGFPVFRRNILSPSSGQICITPPSLTCMASVTNAILAAVTPPKLQSLLGIMTCTDGAGVGRSV